MASLEEKSVVTVCFVENVVDKTRKEGKKMRKRAFYSFLYVLTVVMTSVPLVRADLSSDSLQIGQWFSKEVGNLMAFQAASTHFLPGDTVGFPGVEVGIAGDVSAKKLDVKGFRGLSLSTLDNKGSEINLPASIPAPMLVLHAKVGLPGGWDVGAKGGSLGFDTTSGNAKTKFSNKVFGVEVRKNLLGGGLTGAVLPDLSVSLGYDHASGDVTRNEVYNGAITGGTLDADTTWKSKWNVGAITARAVVSKKFFVLTPFLGAGVTKLTGNTDTTVGIVGTATPGGTQNISVTGSAKNNKSIVHALAGLEISPVPFFKLGLGGLVAKDLWSASLDLRVQFP